MKGSISRACIIAGFSASWLVAGGCSTFSVFQAEPLPALPPTPPGYVQVPHPDGTDVGDLLAIFTDRSAPDPLSLKDCDQDFWKLQAATRSKDELIQGAREFVRVDPVKYHWCFYGKLFELEEQMKASVYIDERQAHVLKAYQFLTPMSRAFLLEYSDSRYLRWAVNRYRRLSEYVFYRRVELSPQATSELTSSSNPFGNYRPAAEPPKGILEKYGLVPKAELQDGALDGEGKPATAQLPGTGTIPAPAQAAGDAKAAPGTPQEVHAAVEDSKPIEQAAAASPAEAAQAPAGEPKTPAAPQPQSDGPGRAPATAAPATDAPVTEAPAAPTAPAAEAPAAPAASQSP